MFRFLSSQSFEDNKIVKYLLNSTVENHKSKMLSHAKILEIKKIKLS